MNTVTLKIKRLPHCKGLPSYAVKGSAGMDLTAGIDEPYTLLPGERCALPSGIIIVVPEGHEAQIRGRSGLAKKFGITLSNSVGTVDHGFVGEILLLMMNHGKEPYTFQPGERVCQMIVVPVPYIELEEIDELPDTERGANGFGSSGRCEATCKTDPIFKAMLANEAEFAHQNIVTISGVKQMHKLLTGMSSDFAQLDKEAREKTAKLLTDNIDFISPTDAAQLLDLPTPEEEEHD